MEFRNITLKGDRNTFNKAVFSKEFSLDEYGFTWLDSNAMKLVDSKYTSFELFWDPIPGAKSYILVLVDYDSTKVFGFPFIHWIVSNIKTNYIEPSANLNNKIITQGVNSSVPGRKDENSKGIIYPILGTGYRSASFEDAIGFYPLLPFDVPHHYNIRIMGLSIDKVDIEDGFYIGDLLEKVTKYIVGIHNKTFLYRGKR